MRDCCALRTASLCLWSNALGGSGGIDGMSTLGFFLLRFSFPVVGARRFLSRRSPDVSKDNVLEVVGGEATRGEEASYGTRLGLKLLRGVERPSPSSRLPIELLPGLGIPFETCGVRMLAHTSASLVRAATKLASCWAAVPSNEHVLAGLRELLLLLLWLGDPPLLPRPAERTGLGDFRVLLLLVVEIGGLAGI